MNVPLVSVGARVAAVVLTYHPDPETCENIVRILEQVERVFIVNNSPDDATYEALAPVSALPTVRVLDQSGNIGVAAGFNAGMRAALAESFDFAWIFDQDSSVNPGMLDAMLAAHANGGPRAGIVAPALRSKATGIIYRSESGVGVAESKTVISSGSLFSRELMERIGLHDEPMFIDYVDHDICLRACRYGYRNLKVFEAVLDHRFGDSAPVRFLGRRIYLSNYSPMRHFYIARNRIIVLKRFGAGRWFWDDALFSAKAWVKVLLREDHRRDKIRASLKGIIAGLRYPTR